MPEERVYNPDRDTSARLRLLESVAGDVKDAILVTEAEPIDEPGPRIVFVNEGFTKTTGYTSQEVIGKTPRIIQGPGTDREQLDKIRLALSKDEPVRIELVNYRKDGTEFWVEISITPVGDNRGKTTHYVSVLREITERKRMEQELSKANRDLTTIVESITDAFFSLDREWRFTYLNSEAERVLDRARGDLIGKSIWEEFPEAVGLKFYREYNRAVGEQRTVEFEEIYPSLETWFEVKAYPSEAGLSVYFRDVSERKGMEGELKESEERLRTLLVQYASDIITILEANGTIRYESPAVERVLGYRPEEMVGKSILDYVHPDDVEDAVAELGTIRDKRGARGPIEVRFRHKDGSWRYLEGVGNNLINDPTVGRVVLNSRDVTERKRAEEDYRSIFENAVEGIYRTAPDGNLVSANPTLAHIFGYDSPEEMISALADVEQNYVDREQSEEFDRLIREDGRVSGFEYRAYRKNGGIIWVSDTAREVRDDEDALLYYEGFIQDITDRKRSEETLRKSEGSLASAQRMAHVGGWETLIGEDLYWSDELYRIYGFVPRRFVPTYEDFIRVIHPDDRDYVERVQEEVQRSGECPTIECRIVRPDGEVRVVRNSFEVHYGEDGDLKRIAGTVQDITERTWEERRKNAQHDVTRILAETLALADAAPKVLQAICESLGWEVGAFWEIDYETDEARMPHCLQTWNAPTADVSEFVELTHQRTFVKGEELAGRIWESGEPAWISDIMVDENSSTRVRVALKEDLHGAFGFPILLREKVLGVVEFFSREVRQPDKEVLEMMEAIGSQIGQFMERKSFDRRLQHQALHDDLTDLPNRTLFTDRLRHALERAGRGQNNVAVLFLDLDNFKYVNDTLGHDTGDQLLAAAARRLKQCLRPGDTAARLGGDEFAVLLEEVENSSGAERVARRILDALGKPFDLEGHRQFASASIGIVLKHGGDHRPRDLLRSADLAMYKAKRAGKNRHAMFDLETERRSIQRLELENDLRSTLERDEFRIHYQPLILLDTGRVVGMEALVRWEHPRRGLLTPREFIPVAEETGMIVHIGEKILREACHQTREWQESYPSSPPLIIGVNLSARQLQDADFVERVEEILRETGLDPESLTLEITESVLVDDAENHTANLRRLGDLGARLAIDDFGTGYSSLSYLRHLPAGLLKIDGSFVEQVTEAAEDETLLSGIIGIAHGLDLVVAAEGVETAEQAELVESLGCDLAQGRYFSPPLPSEAAEAILRRDASPGDNAP